MAFPLFMSATFLPMLSLSAFMPFRQTFNLFSCLLARLRLHLRLHLRLRQSQFHESHVNKPCEKEFRQAHARVDVEIPFLLLHVMPDFL